MQKNIVLECLSVPETPNADGVVGLGFHDKVVVLDGTTQLFHSAASGCPNCWSPHSGEWWEKCYGWAGPGTYGYECVEHGKFGKCILINGGSPIMARNRNPNHGGKRILAQVFCHPGGTGNNKEWRGSGGCPTLPAQLYLSFIECFAVGERGSFGFADYVSHNLFYV